MSIDQATTESGVLGESEFTHFCAACTACLDAAEEACPECGAAPPPRGWQPLLESPYAYLGRSVDDRYVLDQFLGDGATGYVYRARSKHFNRKFACKIVDTRRYNKKEFEEELLRRFRLEVDAMSRLRNPHVVAIYEAMQFNDGVFALVMDYVDGRTLQELLDRVGRIKLDGALDLLRQVANGLHEAHRVGFIHRDLKPDNIMVERLPASGFFAKILDFGIVHVMGKADATQGFRGTPLYASPEQCLGDPTIDHRSDIYSLGCVFYHCMTGQPPFPGRESLRVMDAHVNKPPPRVADVLDENRVPPRLETLIQSMLAKDPADRPADLSVVIRKIDEIQRDMSRRRTGTSPGRLPTGVPTLSRSEPPTDPQRLATGELPQITHDQAVSAQKESNEATRTQAIEPLLEYRLPGAVAETVSGFTACALNDRGDMATVADQRYRVHLLSLKNDGVYHTLTGAQGLLVAVYLDTKNDLVFAGEMDGTILRWKLDEPDNPTRVAKVSERIYALSSQPDGKSLLCGTERGRVVSVDIEAGTQKSLMDAGSAVSALGFSISENKLIVGHWGGELETIQLPNGARRKLDALPSTAKVIVVSKDGYLAAVLDEGGRVRILSMIDGRPFYTMPIGIQSLRALAFAGDGHLMGLGVVRTKLQLWELRSRPVPGQKTH